jgi:hypothetical protein
MSRPWRIEFKGALYHVLSRGNEQKDIFWDDEDRNCFICIMGEMSDRFDVDTVSFALWVKCPIALMWIFLPMY